MPTIPYYRGSVASGGVVNPTRPVPSFLEMLGSGAASAAGMGSISKLFANPDNDPEVQRAKLLAAQTATEQDKLDVAKHGRQATADMGRDLGIADAFRQPEGRLGAAPATTDQTARAIAGAYQGAVANGADPKIANAMMSSFALQMGGPAGDELAVKVQSYLAGNYIKENESPSLARQDVVRDDQQAAAQQIQDSKNATDRYGFGVAAATSRANNGEDNATSRRGQDVSASTSLRTNSDDNATSRYNNAYNKVADVYKDSAKPAQQSTTVERDAKGNIIKRVDKRVGPVPSGRPAPQGRAASGGAKPPQRIKLDAQGNIVG